jgi:hypothetical protein
MQGAGQRKYFQANETPEISDCHWKMSFHCLTMASARFISIWRGCSDGTDLFLPGRSEVYLFRDGKRVINLNAEIPG